MKKKDAKKSYKSIFLIIVLIVILSITIIFTYNLKKNKGDINEKPSPLMNLLSLIGNKPYTSPLSAENNGYSCAYHNSESCEGGSPSECYEYTCCYTDCSGYACSYSDKNFGSIHDGHCDESLPSPGPNFCDGKGKCIKNPCICPKTNGNLCQKETDKKCGKPPKVPKGLSECGSSGACSVGIVTIQVFDKPGEEKTPCTCELARLVNYYTCQNSIETTGYPPSKLKIIVEVDISNDAEYPTAATDIISEENGIKTIGMVLNGPFGFVFDTSNLIHESQHANLLSRFNNPKIPRWAQEGLAIMKEPRGPLTDSCMHFENLVNYLENLPPNFDFGQILTWDNPPGNDETILCYIFGSGIVNLLVKNSGGDCNAVRKFYKTTEQAMKNGNTQNSWINAIKNNYPGLGINNPNDLLEKLKSEVQSQLGKDGSIRSGCNPCTC
ncbi:MAG: hypothetical protein Q8N99_03005 [Nanoarchaeota archaeon]|nr:hypothetical protein [Nanoarchaeota archaeon]